MSVGALGVATSYRRPTLDDPSPFTDPYSYPGSNAACRIAQGIVSSWSTKQVPWRQHINDRAPVDSAQIGAITLAKCHPLEKKTAVKWAGVERWQAYDFAFGPDAAALLPHLSSGLIYEPGRSASDRQGAAGQP